MADGATETEAAANAHESARLWLSVARAEQRSIPAPSNPRPASGKFNVRLPRSLHAELQKRALRDRVSLNTLVVSLLAADTMQVA